MGPGLGQHGNDGGTHHATSAHGRTRETNLQLAQCHTNSLLVGTVEGVRASRLSASRLQRGSVSVDVSPREDDRGPSGLDELVALTKRAVRCQSEVHQAMVHVVGRFSDVLCQLSSEHVVDLSEHRRENLADAVAIRQELEILVKHVDGNRDALVHCEAELENLGAQGAETQRAVDALVEREDLQGDGEGDREGPRGGEDGPNLVHQPGRGHLLPRAGRFGTLWG